MKKIIKSIGFFISGMMTVGIVTACTHHEEPMEVETKTTDEESDEEPRPGISFELESDSLENEVEEIWIEPTDWDEENLGVDL